MSRFSPAIHDEFPYLNGVSQEKGAWGKTCGEGPAATEGQGAPVPTGPVWEGPAPGPRGTGDTFWAKTPEVPSLIREPPHRFQINCCWEYYDIVW